VPELPWLAMAEIRGILQRRTDLSTFVVHLTRRRDPNYGPQDALVDIARSSRLKAQSALGWAKTQDVPNDPARQSQRVVCFSETPLEHINLMCGPINGRTIAMEPYGIALTKLKARKLGVNPVWYVDMTPGRSWTIAHTLDRLRDQILDPAVDRDFHESALAKLFPFIEQMGTWQNSLKEFWWEREWRHVGDFQIPATGVIWLCPEGEITQVNERVGRELSPWLDPRWGLEEIIAHLSGFPLSDVSPFLAAPPEPEPPPEAAWDDDIPF
jgi:abortive phage resistance protein AbiGi (putative antitoxin)